MQEVGLLDTLLAKKGEAFELGIRDAFSLQDDEHLFWLESGQIDLFAIEAEGRRHFLSHFEAGSLLLSFPGRKDLAVFALPTPKAVIRKIALQNYIEMRLNPVLKGESDAKLTDFVQHFEGLIDMDTLDKTSVWQQPRAFGKQILKALSQRNKQIELEQLEKARLRSELDQKNFHSAREQLQTVFSQQEPMQRAVGHNLLVNTCQIIGDHLQLTFTPLQHKLASNEIFNNVYELCAYSNIYYREIHLSKNWWTCDSGPFLGFYKENSQPVALIPKDGKYELIDIAKGTRTIVNEEVNALLLKEGFMFYRSFPKKNWISAKDLLRFSLFKKTPIFLSVFLFGLAMGCLNLFYPFFNYVLFQYVIPYSDRSLLTQVIAGIFIISVSTQLFMFGRDYTVLRLEALSDHDLESGIWQRVLSLSVQFFSRFELGDLIMRVFSINTIRKSLTGSTIQVLFNSFFSLLYLIPMFYYSPMLALVGASFVLAIASLNAWCFFASLRYNQVILESKGKANGLVLQQLSAISKIRSAGAEKISFTNWEKIFQPMKKVEWQMQKLTIFSYVANYISSTLSPFLIFAIALYVIKEKTALPFTIGDFLAFLAAFTPFTLAVTDLSNILIELTPLFSLWKRGRAILEERLEVEGNKTDPHTFSGDVQIDHLFFRYESSSPLILEDISLHAKPGEFIGIIGPSGCGKSSLVKLLVGFEKPESGAIYFDGKDLSTLDIRKVRRQLGIVLQNESLLDGTIRDNLTTKGSYSDEEISHILKLTGFDEDLRRLPMGLHTVLMDGGNTLSGGQKQRLLIARALISKPKILILDEATSALDNKTQEIVERSLKHINITRIVIAHRLSTICHADRIYLINKGKIEAVGSYAEIKSKIGF